MAGGDGACMGCGEKTTVHLVTATIEALMQPRVAKLVARLDELIAGLDAQARELLSADADLDLAAVADGHGGRAARRRGSRSSCAAHQPRSATLKDLRWRYVEGPSGHGPRAAGHHQQHRLLVGVGEHLPLQPVPLPLGQPPLPGRALHRASASSRGTCGRWRDDFVAVRRAEQLLDGSYDAERDEAFLQAFDWRQFTRRGVRRSARRSWRSAATAPCWTSASRTSRA